MVAIDQSKQFITKILSSDSPSHAYLFFGSPLSSKEENAREFAKGLLCGNLAARPCGTCNSCHKFESGNHPDFRLINAEGDKIKIAQIRAVKSELQYPALESKRKVFLLLKTEGLTEEAAESMLKILEEPMIPAVFILVASHPSSLLPTIVSRCQRVPFQVSGTASQRDRLVEEMGVAPEVATLLAGLEVPREEAKEWEGVLTDVMPALFSETRTPLELLDKVIVLEDHKEHAEWIIHLLYGFYRDVAVLKSGWEEGVLLSKFKAHIFAVSNELEWGQVWERAQMILEARKHLEHSGNFRLVFENLLWKLRS